MNVTSHVHRFCRQSLIALLRQARSYVASDSVRLCRRWPGFPILHRRPLSPGEQGCWYSFDSLAVARTPSPPAPALFPAPYSNKTLFSGTTLFQGSKTASHTQKTPEDNSLPLFVVELDFQSNAFSPYRCPSLRLRADGVGNLFSRGANRRNHL